MTGMMEIRRSVSDMIEPAPPTAGHSRSSVAGSCRVLHCSSQAGSTWSLPLQPAAEAWPVCSRHRDELIAGGRWAARHGRFPAVGRWLLMGDDLTTWRAPKS
jgi:hypothetical protein